MPYFDDRLDREDERQVMEYMREVRLLRAKVERMRVLLVTHQWGGNGYCPECAAYIESGRHGPGCKWAAEMESEVGL